MGTLLTNNEVQESIARLRTLPYKHGEMAGRHWGHKRHSLCSFPSKMKPAFASTLVELFSHRGGVVLDPFCGCGTIPFEAALQGRKAIGTDLSTLAKVITSAKIQPSSEEETRFLLGELAEAIGSRWQQVDLSPMEPEIRDFFHEQTGREILAARSFLSEVSNNFEHGAAALFLTACLAHLLHGNRPYALSRRSHNIIPIPPKGPTFYKPVVEALTNKVSRFLSCELPSVFQEGSAFECSADNLPIDDASVDTVITSPPFLGTTDFLRHNRLRLWLVGWSYSVQARRKLDFLEHDRRPERYLPILKELYRVLRPGSLAIFHVGIVKTINMGDLLAPLFAEAGFEEKGRVWEDARTLETHGRTDRGGTHTHGVIVLQRT